MVVNLNMNDQQIVRGSFENVAAEPATNLFDGRMIYDTAAKAIKYYDAGAAEWKTVAKLEDLEQFSTLVGGFDASGGAVPQSGSGDGGESIYDKPFKVSVAVQDTCTCNQLHVIIHVLLCCVYILFFLGIINNRILDF